MICSFVFLLFVGEFTVEKEFPIEVKHVHFQLMSFFRMHVDETLILFSKSTAYQFDKQGHLLQQFGKTGEGPGEFENIVQVYSNGTHLIVQDANRDEISIFDSAGQFVTRYTPRRSDFYFLKGHSITVDSDQFLEGKAPLVPFKFTSDFQIEKSGPEFHFVRPEIKKYHYDFSSFFLCEADDSLYVMDETMPEVTVYDKNLKQVRTFRVNLPQYQPPGETWDHSKSRKQVVRTMGQYSWIQGISALKQGLAIAYSAPDPADIDAELGYLSVVGFDGQPISKTPLKVEDVFLGTVDDYLLILSESDDLQYTLKYYKHHPN